MFFVGRLGQPGAFVLAGTIFAMRLTRERSREETVYELVSGQKRPSLGSGCPYRRRPRQATLQNADQCCNVDDPAIGLSGHGRVLSLPPNTIAHRTDIASVVP